MSKETQKTLHTVCLAVGAFLITMLVAVGGTVLYQYRNASIDLSPSAWVSQDDIDVLKDPKAANKAAYDKMSREAWERAKTQQPQGGWQK